MNHCHSTAVLPLKELSHRGPPALDRPQLSGRSPLCVVTTFFCSASLVLREEIKKDNKPEKTPINPHAIFTDEERRVEVCSWSLGPMNDGNDSTSCGNLGFQGKLLELNLENN